MTDPVEQAWKIHAAQVDWTGKVDAKASFAFAIESAALGATVALSASGRLFAEVDGRLSSVLYWLGLAALFVGAACALLVVLPRLRGAETTTREAGDNFIYFGHLRHWDPRDLAKKLEEGAILDVLSRQCVTMAGIAWRKHRLVQAAMIVGASGIALLVVCGILITT
ncbi:Pycsar system effector family protein [Nocardioides sp.]|uniref:Pycsar system effector family protein n=1 Tax=Nocardioides sp. TaxID=35761 RepID=UPI003D14FAC3